MELLTTRFLRHTPWRYCFAGRCCLSRDMMILSFLIIVFPMLILDIPLGGQQQRCRRPREVWGGWRSCWGCNATDNYGRCVCLRMGLRRLRSSIWMCIQLNGFVQWWKAYPNSDYQLVVALPTGVVSPFDQIFIPVRRTGLFETEETFNSFGLSSCSYSFCGFRDTPQHCNRLAT